MTRNKSSRRRFLKTSGSLATAAGLSTILTARSARAQANERLRLALIGAGGRGTANMLITLPYGADCVAVADPDDKHAAQAADKIAKTGQKTKVDTCRDFRHILDRKDIDAVLVATPDHWHAIAAIRACQAGKDVFVEKPVSHNIREGRAMADATRKYDRIMMVGTQQRSCDHFISAKAFIEAGHLGKIFLTKAWVTYPDKSLGNPDDAAPPAHADYDLWLGPAPEQPFNPSRFHYTWRWFWDYAGGKQADWGIHMLDIIQWYMKVKAPVTVSSGGGLYVLHDGRTTPDTQVTIFNYPEFTCYWEHRQAGGRGVEQGKRHGIAFYGDKGTLVLTRGGWWFYEENEQEPAKAVEGKPELVMFQKHSEAWLQAIRTRKTVVADIEDGHRSTSTCHLGNIAYKTGRTIRWDADNERIIDDKEAEKYLTREYRKPYTLPEV